jgi:hypothetical protein
VVEAPGGGVVILCDLSSACPAQVGIAGPPESLKNSLAKVPQAAIAASAAAREDGHGGWRTDIFLDVGALE